MAASDARPVPRKNVAYRVTFPILDADGDLVTGAASLDSEVSIDGAAFADCTNEATEIATSSGVYYLDLTSSEMNGDTVAVIVKTGTAGAKTTTIVMYPEEAGDYRADVTHFGGTAGTFSSGRPEVNTTHIGGSAISQSGGVANVNAVQISGDSIAADNAEAFFDGTGYAGTNNVIPTVTTVTNQVTANVTGISGDATAADNLEAALDGTGGVTITAALTGNITGNLSGSVGSVTGNVGGNVAGSVGSVTGTVGSVTGLTASDVGAIKAKTDSLTFTQAGHVDANVQRINDVVITGDGQVGTEFGV